MAFKIEDDKYLKRKDPFERYQQLGLNPNGQLVQGGQRGMTASGIPEDAVFLAKDTDIFTANKVYGEGTSGAGMGSFSNQSTGGITDNTNAVDTSRGSGEVAFDVPGGSGQRVTSGSLAAPENGDMSGGAGDNKNNRGSSGYDASHTAVIESLAFNSPTSVNLGNSGEYVSPFAGINLGQPPASEPTPSGEGMLSATNPEQDGSEVNGQDGNTGGIKDGDVKPDEPDAPENKDLAYQDPDKTENKPTIDKEELKRQQEEMLKQQLLAQERIKAEQEQPEAA